MSDEWSMSEELMNRVLAAVPSGGTILELGSGKSTINFAQAGRNVITIEHDPSFINLCVTTGTVSWVLALIEEYGKGNPQPASISKRMEHEQKGWYDRKAIIEGLRDRHYDCIVVDGPTSDIGRAGFLVNLHLFKCDGIPIFFDDMHRIDDLYIARRVAQELERDLLVTNNKPDHKSFSILAP